MNKINSIGSVLSKKKKKKKKKNTQDLKRVGIHVWYFFIEFDLYEIADTGQCSGTCLRTRMS